MLFMTATAQSTQRATAALAWSCAFGGRGDQGLSIEVYPVSSGTKRTHNPEEAR